MSKDKESRKFRLIHGVCTCGIAWWSTEPELEKIVPCGYCGRIPNWADIVRASKQRKQRHAKRKQGSTA